MNKIQSLRKTVEYLLDPNYHYQWTNSCRSNVGTLIRVVFNVPYEKEFIVDIYGPSDYSCGVVSKHKIKELEDIGFTHKELNELEFLNNNDILIKAKLPIVKIKDTNGFTLNQLENELKVDKQSVIKYIQAWVDILEEEVKPILKIRLECSIPESLTIIQKDSYLDVKEVNNAYYE